MVMADTLREVRKASKTTITELLYTGLILLVSSIILLQPDSILGVSGIDPTTILDQPGWVGLAGYGGAGGPMLLTKFVEWAPSPLPSADSDATIQADDTEQGSESESADSEDESTTDEDESEAAEPAVERSK